MALTEKLLILVVGWLLGLLGPAIVDSIRRRRDNQLGRHALLAELREISMSLALAAYAIRMDQGKADRRFLEWLKFDMESHATTTEMKGLVPQLHKMLKLTDSDLAKMNQVAERRPGKATMLQHIAAPLLDSRVSALWSFETDFQRQILEIKHHLSLLQDLVDRSRKYFDLTFTKLEGDNYRLVSENLVQTHDQYGNRAELVVNKIRAIVGSNR